MLINRFIRGRSVCFASTHSPLSIIITVKLSNKNANLVRHFPSQRVSYSAFITRFCFPFSRLPRSRRLGQQSPPSFSKSNFGRKYINEWRSLSVWPRLTNKLLQHVANKLLPAFCKPISGHSFPTHSRPPQTERRPIPAGIRHKIDCEQGREIDTGRDRASGISMMALSGDK